MFAQPASNGLSVVLYGRNDGHGYNLARRAALSLNAFAHVLSDDDEILFADCNTPDSMPTFPESISDTLTEKARSLLRVIRIRPAAFRRLVPGTRLKVHEPLCRNVLVRRCRADHRWILSTNSDIVPVFGPEGTPLRDLTQDLDPARLHIAPRGEVPEQLWEGIDRRDPAQVHRLFRRWGETLGCAEEVHCGRVVLHDGPGDFQLIGRETLHAIDAFDEAILQGWHVDGNLCARMNVHTGANLSLAGRVVAYHCDHNRVATPTHRSGFSSESAHDLVHGIRRADLPAQRAGWGAPAEVFEEFRLDSDAGLRFGDRILELLGGPAPHVRSRLERESFNSSLAHPAAASFPHLASHLATLPAGGVVAYAGRDPAMVGLLRDFLATRRQSLLVCPDLRADGDAEFWKRWRSSSAVVFDAWAGDLVGERTEWPRDLRSPSAPVGDGVRRQEGVLLRLHREAIRAGKAPPFLFVGSQNTWLDIDLNRHFDLALTPFASHVRPGLARRTEPAWREGLRSWWNRPCKTRKGPV